MVSEFEAGHFEHGVFLAFNLALFRTAARYTTPHPLDFPVCIPQQRISFDTPEGEPTKHPRYDNALIYLAQHNYTFPVAFGSIGFVSSGKSFSVALQPRKA